jgi:hypothetical protein
MKSETSPIFIVGCGHSGTTLLLRVLGAHSRICAIPFESSFALKWPAPCQAAHDFFTHCDVFASRMGKARWVEKTPKHIYFLKEILRYFPDGKILLLLRDGRDVACSFQDRNGSLESGLSRWMKDNQAGRPFWNHPQVRPVRYEDLVTDFEKTVRGVIEFAGERFEDSVCDYHKSPRYFFTHRIEKPPNAFGENHNSYRNWQINQPLFDGRGKWRRLTGEEKQLIKDKAGEMLMEYGYASDADW